MKMALEPLHGPAIVTSLGETFDATGFRPFWLDNLGLCGFFAYDADGADSFGYQIVHWDGIAYVRNNDLSAFKGGHLTYDFQTDNLLIHASVLGGGLQLLEAYTGSWIPPALVSGGVAGMWTRYFDRYLRAYLGRVESRPLGSTIWTSPTLEYTFPFPGGRDLGATDAVISDYGGGLLAIGYQNGDIWIYDPVNLTHIGEWKTIDSENKGIWYSQRFKIWISMHNETGPSRNEIRVWANETRPATLSDPIALQAINRGRVSDMQVQLLGSADEPINGQLIEFDLVSGPGELLNLQALTDEEGYAITRYACPVSGSGSVQIDANTQL